MTTHIFADISAVRRYAATQLGRNDATNYDVTHDSSVEGLAYAIVAQDGFAYGEDMTGVLTEMFADTSDYGWSKWVEEKREMKT